MYIHSLGIDVPMIISLLLVKRQDSFKPSWDPSLQIHLAKHFIRPLFNKQTNK